MPEAKIQFLPKTCVAGLNLEISQPHGYASKKRWGNFSSPSRKARQGKPRKKWFGWSTLEVIGKESRKGKEKSSPEFLSSRLKFVRNGELERSSYPLDHSRRSCAAG